MLDFNLQLHFVLWQTALWIKWIFFFTFDGCHFPIGEVL